MRDDTSDTAVEPAFDQRLAFLLAMAMFVLVFDTSLMNVSISSVVDDLKTTVSSVQAAIALEALVSAAFILIGSKVGDLIGRKRAYVIGLLAYAVGALAMTVAQSVIAIVVFWALIGGLGASLLMPAMQSLIHGNFQGAAQKKVYALGRRLGGDRRRDRTTARWLHHDVPVVARRLPARGADHRRRAVWHRACPRRAVHGPPTGRCDRCGPVRPRHGRHRAGHPGVAGRRRCRRRAPGGRGGRTRVARLLAPAAQARGEADPARPGPVPIEDVPVRDLGTDAPEHRPGRGDDRAADLPADGARVQRDADGPVARPALAHDVRRGGARREEGRGRGARARSSEPASRSFRSAWCC